MPVPLALNYRPISNLSVLSKLLERLVVRQLVNYLTSADLLPFPMRRRDIRLDEV